jgi:hypothetical protein
MAWTSTAALACAILIAPAAATETAAQNPPADDERPLVTVGLGTGPIVTSYQLAELPRVVAGWAASSFLVKEASGLTGSVQVRLRRSLLLEGEVTYASGVHSQATTQSEYSQFGRPAQFVADTTFSIDQSLSQTSVAANLLVPVDTAVPRVSTFIGAGGGVRATATRFDTSLSCAPRVPTGCDGRPNVESGERGTAFAPILQVSYGVDIVIRPRLSGFAALRWPFELNSDYRDNHLTGFGVTGGVRLAVGPTTFGTRQLKKGERRPSDLRTGALLGLVSGGIVGGILAAGSSSDDLRSLAPPVMSLYGAGIGAAIGVVLDMTGRHRP